MLDNKKLKTTLTTNFQLPKQVNQAKEEAFAKIKASKDSEAAETEVSSTISSTSETDFTSKPDFTSETDFIPKPDFAHKTSKSSYKQNFYKGFAAIAASAAIFSIICTANPALADNIPVVGSVFQTLGKSLGFYGDFKHYAKPLDTGSSTDADTSADPEHPAKFYMVSAPAHCAYETRLIKMADANHRPLGSVETCNKRTINQFIHPDVLKTCQLSMGMTELDPGSNWNTMPSHTHERRMEIYTYFELPEGQVVFHMCGEPTQTRHIVMHNEDAVISPSWSIHSGVGTSNYTFIWAMGGENMEFDDMDNIATTDLR